MQTVLLLGGIIMFFVGLVFTAVGIASSMTLLLIIGLVVLLIGGGMLFVFLRQKAEANKLRETGTMVMATITAFTPNLSVTINGRHPYILHCSYNGMVYQADYNKTTVPDLVGRQVPVYLAMDGSGKYLVDLKALR